MANRVTGGTGDNLLKGLAGVTDIISGNGGNDWLVPYTHGRLDAPDHCDGGTGIDTLQVDASAETRKVYFSMRRITSDSGNFEITTANMERAVFKGGAGINIFDCSEISGGIIDGHATGIDAFVYSYEKMTTPVVSTFYKTMQIGGQTGLRVNNIDYVVITGGSSNDTLTSLTNGDDELRGGGGNDTLNGGFGSDRLDGGTGIDTVDHTFYDGSVVANLTTGKVTFPGNTGVDTLISIENFNSGNGADTLTGSSVDNVLKANGGNDTLYGEGGNDTLDGGDQNDILRGGAGRDILLGGEGNDILDGGADLDLLLDGGTGFDSADFRFFNGGMKVDLFNGKATAVGLGGSETLRSIEAVYTGNGNDQINGDSFVNVLSGGGGKDTLSGGGDNDTLYGNAGNDTLEGGYGNDTLYGNEDGDILIGGDGADVMYGHSGADDGVRDTFVFDDYHCELGVNRDRILAFGANDVIDLRLIDANVRTVEDEGFNFIGAEAFHRRAGELRMVSHVVQADTDGDGAADFEIYVSRTGLSFGDFLL